MFADAKTAADALSALKPFLFFVLGLVLAFALMVSVVRWVFRR
jgi:hypothetical protein